MGIACQDALENAFNGGISRPLSSGGWGPSPAKKSVPSGDGNWVGGVGVTPPNTVIVVEPVQIRFAFGLVDSVVPWIENVWLPFCRLSAERGVSVSSASSMPSPLRSPTFVIVISVYDALLVPEVTVTAAG